MKRSSNDSIAVRRRVAIRKWFVQRHHLDGGSLGDLSKDGDVVWSKVRCDGIERTTPFSVIGAKGSAREWLSIEDWDADIIDLGAGGEPWGAWDAILENFGGN